jgi:hypothetical protein
MPITDDNLMTTAQAAAHLKLREQTLRLLRCRGRGPQHVRRGGPGGQGRGGVHWYAPAELDRWAAARGKAHDHAAVEATVANTVDIAA